MEGTLFLRKHTDSDDNEVDEDNPWDDTKLIKAYDKAMNKAKQKILKKIQAEVETTNEEIQDLLSDASIGSKKNKKKKKNKIKNKPKTKSWKVGDACRAIYFEDGEEYEAEIIALINNEWCTVRFVGYGNEDDVMLEELIPSLGKHMIQLQEQTAIQDYIMAAENERDTENQNNTTDPHDKEEALPNKMGRKPNTSNPRKIHFPQRTPLFSLSPPPPPPQFPVGGLPFNSNMCTGPPTFLSEDETLNTMLLSWYMCGYYTGYYQRGSKPPRINRHQ